jgi:hypothetical protein
MPELTLLSLTKEPLHASETQHQGRCGDDHWGLCCLAIVAFVIASAVDYADKGEWKPTGDGKTIVHTKRGKSNMLHRV